MFDKKKIINLPGRLYLDLHEWVDRSQVKKVVWRRMIWKKIKKCRKWITYQFLWDFTVKQTLPSLYVCTYLRNVALKMKKFPFAKDIRNEIFINIQFVKSVITFLWKGGKLLVLLIPFTTFLLLISGWNHSNISDPVFNFLLYIKSIWFKE